MWTKEHRARQAAFERRRYPTDLTGQEWQVIQPLLPSASSRGRRPGVDLREMLNAIRYLARAGCGCYPAADFVMLRIENLASRVRLSSQRHPDQKVSRER
jgi:hypothetical protein